jgi:hypothetical protein
MKVTKKKESSNKHYLIHVYQDKELLVHLKSIPTNGEQKLKKVAKIMKDAAYEDIVKGKYYFYNIVEQTTKSIEVYPSQEVTG